MGITGTGRATSRKANAAPALPKWPARCRWPALPESAANTGAPTFVALRLALREGLAARDSSDLGALLLPV